MKPTLANGEPLNGQTAVPANVLDTLRHLRARSPQESLGLQSDRGLLKAFVLAAIGTGVVFVALTVVPYLIHKAKPADQQPTASGGNEPAPAATTSPTPPGDQTAKAPAADPSKPKAKGKDLPDVLGESGVKTGSPKVNPLDKKEDDIFKELGPK
ncbi:MAG TPA: hypothetical protein VHR66_27355 [Gemmataceae bacterium]|jgi:hypothetical protein|nr:hypothetical protein [Gemmataceae bacterium]